MRDHAQGKPSEEENMHETARRRGRPKGIRTTTQGLTDRQARIVDAIRDYTRQHGYPPSMRQIGEAVGLASTSSVSHQLIRLEAMGFVSRDPHRPRAYRVLTVAPTADDVDELPAEDGRATSSVAVPVLGRIAAGAPITAEEHITDILTVPSQLVGNGDLFALTVVGDSMAGEGSILDGDLVVVRHQPDAENGDVVAAMIDGEATVKRLRRTGQGVWLLPDNTAYDPIRGSAAVILGKVTAVLRHL